MANEVGTSSQNFGDEKEEISFMTTEESTEAMLNDVDENIVRFVVDSGATSPN